MSVVHTGGTDILCSYCGRPIVGGPFVTGNAGMYHPECTQSPYAKPMFCGQSSELEIRVADLERQIETIRNDTLEEAAGLCESRGLMFHDRYECADAIRKLKRYAECRQRGIEGGMT